MRTLDVQQLNAMCPGTLMAALDIRFAEGPDPDTLAAVLPVDPRVGQPFGRVHGGAIVALAETVGSGLSQSQCPAGRVALCTEIGASHVRGADRGSLRAVARFLHRGNTAHVIAVEVTDQDGTLVSTCRMTTRLVRTPAETEKASGPTPP